MSRAAFLSLFLLALPAQAETLPVIDADWPALRVHAKQLLADLETLGVPLSADSRKALAPLLAQAMPDDPLASSHAVQKLLDAHCLLGVTINPESRVKTTRGPRKAELIRDRTTSVLVKVNNDGGVTHPLGADSPHKYVAKSKDADAWLELAVRNDKPFRDSLSGDKVEYRVLQLTARQAGKREATILFDVGQGSQELGFRAEVPVLFAIRPK